VFFCFFIYLFLFIIFFLQRRCKYTGFKGQARVIIPRMTACFECTLELFPPRTTYPICTIANTPRLPEHCVEWASEIKWKDHRQGKHAVSYCSNN